MCDASRDCGFTMGIIKWGVGTALKLCERYSDDENCDADTLSWWNTINDNLAPLPYDDETGYMIDEKCEFVCPHR